MQAWCARVGVRSFTATSPRALHSGAARDSESSRDVLLECGATARHTLLSRNFSPWASVSGGPSVQREYLIRPPARRWTADALLVLIHCFGCAELEIAKFEAAADKFGMALLAPQGIGHSFNAPHCCGPAGSPPRRRRLHRCVRPRARAAAGGGGRGLRQRFLERRLHGVAPRQRRRANALARGRAGVGPRVCRARCVADARLHPPLRR